MKRFFGWKVAFVLSIALNLGIASTSYGHAAGVSLYAFCYGQGTLFAYDIRFPEDAPNSIVVATNFGLLVSDDAGETFRWVCPLAYSVQPDPDFRVTTPPSMSVLPDGTIFMLPLTGYQASHDRACNFAGPTSGTFSRADMRGLAYDRSRPNEVLVAVNWPADPPYGIYRSTNRGDSFTATKVVGTISSIFEDVLLVPDADTMYTLSKEGEGAEYYVWRSDESGAKSAQIRQEFGGVNAYFAGTDPDDEDTVYLTVSATSAVPCGPRTTVYRTTDRWDSREPIESREGILAGTIPQSEQAVLLGWKTGGIERVTGASETEIVATLSEDMSLFALGPTSEEIAIGGVGAGDALVLLHDLTTGERRTLLSRSNIVDVANCPADSGTSNACAALWNAIADEYGFAGRTPKNERDGGDDGPDGGPSADAGNQNGGTGCSCAAAPARGHGSLLLLLVLPGCLLVLRAAIRAARQAQRGR